MFCPKCDLPMPCEKCGFGKITDATRKQTERIKKLWKCDKAYIDSLKRGV